MNLSGALHASECFTPREHAIFTFINKHFGQGGCVIKCFECMGVSKEDALYKYYGHRRGYEPDIERYAKFCSAVLTIMCDGQLLGNMMKLPRIQQKMVSALSLVPIDMPGSDIAPTENDIEDNLMCVVCRVVKGNLAIVVGCDCEYIRGMCHDCWERNSKKCYLCRVQCSHAVPDFERNKLVHERYGDRTAIDRENGQLLYDFEKMQLEAHVSAMRAEFEKKLEAYQHRAEEALQKRREEWEETGTIDVNSFSLSLKSPSIMLD